MNVKIEESLEFLAFALKEEKNLEINEKNIPSIVLGCDLLDKFIEWYPCDKFSVDADLESGNVVIDISYNSGIIDIKVVNIIIYALITYGNSVTFDAKRTQEGDIISIVFQGVFV